MIGVSIQLIGEERPRPCRWDPSDLTMLADLDRAVGGLGKIDLACVWHLLAIFWATSSAREEMTLREFARRLPVDPDKIQRLTNGARILWPTITL